MFTRGSPALLGVPTPGGRHPCLSLGCCCRGVCLGSRMAPPAHSLSALGADWQQAPLEPPWACLAAREEVSEGAAAEQAASSHPTSSRGQPAWPGGSSAAPVSPGQPPPLTGLHNLSQSWGCCPSCTGWTFRSVLMASVPSFPVAHTPFRGCEVCLDCPESLLCQGKSTTRDSRLRPADSHPGSPARDGGAPLSSQWGSPLGGCLVAIRWAGHGEPGNGLLDLCLLGCLPSWACTWGRPNWLHLQPGEQPQRQTAVWAGCLEPGRQGGGGGQPHKTAASLPLGTGTPLPGAGEYVKAVCCWVLDSAGGEVIPP